MMNSKFSSFERVKAFTLIELLLVIAIVSLLAALLMPGLKAARDQAKTILCMNNMRQASQGIFLYANDNNDKFPFWSNNATWNGSIYQWDGVGPSSTTWQHYIGTKYMGEPENAYYTSSVILHSMTHCPADQSIDSVGNMVRSIGINGVASPGFAWWTAWPSPSGVTGASISSFGSPASTCLVMDCGDGTTGAISEWGQSSRNWAITSNNLDHYLRHHNGFNVVFVDGHGEWKSKTWIMNILQGPNPQNDPFFDWTNQW